MRIDSAAAGKVRLCVFLAFNNRGYTDATTTLIGFFARKGRELEELLADDRLMARAVLEYPACNDSSSTYPLQMVCYPSSMLTNTPDTSCGIIEFDAHEQVFHGRFCIFALTVPSYVPSPVPSSLSSNQHRGIRLISYQTGRGRQARSITMCFLLRRYLPLVVHC